MGKNCGNLWLTIIFSILESREGIWITCLNWMVWKSFELLDEVSWFL